jgi:predicted enzyme related to lactoylglutathione lyase
MNMKRIAGLGGIFIKAKDPKAMAAWYQEHLGLDFNQQVYIDLPFTDEEGKPASGSNVLSFFKQDSAYFNPSEKQVMINLRVNDLFDLLKLLKEEGVTIVGDPMDESYGKFGWIMDLEGNKIELWEPPVKKG